MLWARAGVATGACGGTLDPLPSAEPLANPGGIPAAVRHATDADHVSGDPVVHCVRESLREQPVVTPVHGVDAGVQVQGVDVCEQGIQEAQAQSLGLAIVEPEAVDGVVLRLIENLDLHSTDLRMRAFASSQSVVRDRPSLMRLSLARSTSACQAGDGRSSPERHRSAQISSSTRSLSEIVIWSNSSVISIVSRACPWLSAGVL